MTSLTLEWERIAILGTCVNLARGGRPVPDDVKLRLREVQQRVFAGREQSPWLPLAHECSLSPCDQDILACAVAPEAEPRIGWMFQELQSGISSPYPTPALVQELLFLDEGDTAEMRRSFSHEAPLYRHGLLKSGPFAMYQPVLPTSRARERLIGIAAPGETFAPPGTIGLPAQGTWEDLVLPASCLQSLREFMLWVTHRETVVTVWGARTAGGPVALFSGPSGTGKTFAAGVIASSLRLPLYRVDLGMLVSKYIGETEKNLNALFDAAAESPVMLLFDEADSLFGKRGEVRDARDRYANMEISHLLSRIESHSGPCILTTNLREHIDSAFARRFQVVVDFPRPDAVDRGRLWALHLPPRAPRESDVDAARLGGAVELTGGQIRNAAVHAAFLAAGEDKPIALTHIASAIWTELAKEGREIPPSRLGFLVGYLKKGRQ